MKKITVLLLTGLFMGNICASAQETKLNTSVNTLKQRIQLTGYAQTGYTYDDTQNAKSTADIKRIIFIANGRITDQWSCFFMYNFNAGGTLLEVHTSYKFSDAFNIRLGQFKTPFTIEGPLSPTEMELIDCYSQATNYYTAVGPHDPLMGTTTGRDLGVMLSGSVLSNRLGYEIALMNGQGINVRDGNTHKDFVAKLQATPVKGLMLSTSAIIGKGHAVGQSAANPDIQVGDDYTRNRWSAGLIWNMLSGLSVRSEYLIGKDGAVNSEGYYASATCNILPKLDVIASYDYFNKNKTLNMQQTNYTAGVQYWFYPRCRIQAQYTLKDNKNKLGNVIQAQLQVRF